MTRSLKVLGITGPIRTTDRPAPHGKFPVPASSRHRSGIRVHPAPPSFTPRRVDGEAPIIDLHSDAYFMGQALREARKAYAAGEVPVGAVVVREGKIISRAWNQVETLKDATAHAEMLALTAAQQALGDWRLEKCTLYVTKEPCPMCAGAIVHCRPGRVVFGCPDPKAGAAGSWINLLESNPPLNHRCDVTPGILGEECLGILQGFFREARARNKADKKSDPTPGG